MTELAKYFGPIVFEKIVETISDYLSTNAVPENSEEERRKTIIVEDTNGNKTKVNIILGEGDSLRLIQSLLGEYMV